MCCMSNPVCVLSCSVFPTLCDNTFAFSIGAMVPAQVEEGNLRLSTTFLEHGTVTLPLANQKTFCKQVLLFVLIPSPNNSPFKNSSSGTIFRAGFWTRARLPRLLACWIKQALLSNQHLFIEHQISSGEQSVFSSITLMLKKVWKLLILLRWTKKRRKYV